MKWKTHITKGKEERNFLQVANLPYQLETAGMWIYVQVCFWAQKWVPIYRKPTKVKIFTELLCETKFWRHVCPRYWISHQGTNQTYFSPSLTTLGFQMVQIKVLFLCQFPSLRKKKSSEATCHCPDFAFSCFITINYKSTSAGKPFCRSRRCSCSLGKGACQQRCEDA